MRYINSPAFGLRVEISSFRHAIMMLGYKRLKRWLALLLATASKDVNLKPVMFAAVRRGLLMEELGARQRRRGDAQRDVHLRRVLAARPHVPAALLRTAGQHPGARARVPGAGRRRPARTSPTSQLVRAIENESLFDFREAAEALMMSVSEINRAQLRALTAASQLE